jgi:hypothetical protein
MRKNLNIKNGNNKLQKNEVFVSLNKTFENFIADKNSKEKKGKKIMSLKSFSYNNGLLFKQFNNSSFEGKKIPLYKCNTLRKHITLKAINKKNLYYKLKLLNISNKNNDSNKYLFNSSFSHSLTKNELNNSLNCLKVTNLKKNIYIFKDKKGKNNINALSNLINYKKNSFPFKVNMAKKRKNEKLKNNSKMFNKTEDMKLNNYLNENVFTNSIEVNKDNYNNIFICDSNKYNKLKIIKSNNSKFHENQFNTHNSQNNETITKDEYSLLIKKINILLEEKKLYIKKFVILQKENQKLKEEIASKKNRKDEINEIKSLNDELKKQNLLLKEEVNNLKSKINELLAINKKNTFKGKLLEDIPMGYFESFLSTIGGLSLPSTERYIKKLEKENDELSSELSRYKQMILTKNNN